MKLKKVKNLKIVTLLDNSVNTLGPLAHWGLSMLLTYNDPEGVARRLLMDTGSDRDSLIRNAKLLTVSLSGIDSVVLSHGHLDHTAATVEVAEANPGIRIHAHSSAFEERYYINDKGERRRQSPPKGEGLAELESAGARITFSRSPVEVSPGVWATGEVPRRGFETIMELNGGKVVREENGVEVDDLIPDDQSIFLDLEDFGLVVVTGCAHAGILNTLSYVSELTGLKPKTLIGGTHLTGRDPEYVSKTIEGLREYNLSVLSPSHCTGFKATSALYAAFPQVFELSYSWKTLDFDEILKKKSATR
jgi:7,8-dihydropterin-6-yl-methyl-4-(beta-D-ribofuranosyl)aminobenzene 5'-phosphate synthase